MTLIKSGVKSADVMSARAHRRGPQILPLSLSLLGSNFRVLIAKSVVKLDFQQTKSSEEWLDSDSFMKSLCFKFPWPLHIIQHVSVCVHLCVLRGGRRMGSNTAKILPYNDDGQ